MSLHRRTLAALCLSGLALSSCGEKRKPGSVGGVGSPPTLAPGEVVSQPLEPAAGGGATLFERLPAERTGIDFVHRWEPGNAIEADQLGNAFAGGAVALGDFDLDGLPDVFLTRPHGGSRLYRNRGGFRFEDVTEATGLESELDGHWSTGATFADVDGDGYHDLVVGGYRGANKVFVNTGDGRFAERGRELGLDFHGASVAVTFADYDRDGDLDAYLLTNRLAGQPKPEGVRVEVKGKVAEVPEAERDNIGFLVKPDDSLHPYDAGQADRLYRNDGGKFVDASAAAGIGGHWHGLSATWWDYDADGWIDLYVANDFFGPDLLYRNNGDGTFAEVAEAALPNTPWFSMGSDAGDLNNDGLLDYIASDMAATTHYKQKVQMGDMDENGWFLESATPRQYMRNAVYVNTGTPRFLEVAHLTGMASTDWTWAVKILDLDCDGRNDVFFSNGMTRQFFHADLRAEVRALKEKTGRNHWDEFAMQKEPNRAFRNLGSLRFEDTGPDWGLDHEGVSFGAAAGDLDGDGDLDLVVNNFAEPVAVYRNGATGGGRLVVALAGAAKNRHGIGAEIRVESESAIQVRVLTPVRGFMGCDVPEAVFGLGDDARVRKLVIRWPSGTVQQLGNLEAGRRYLVAEPPSDSPPPPGLPEDTAGPEPLFAGLVTPARHRESPFDDFALQPLLPNKLSELGPAMAWGDIDGNGHIDVFLGGGAGFAGQLWIQLAGGNLAQVPGGPFEADKHHEDLDATFLDADGDGDLDLYVVSGGVEAPDGDAAYQDRLYLNAGTSLVPAPEGALPDLRFSGSCVAAGDFDGDGDPDLVVGARVVPGKYPLAPGSRLLRNGGGTFTDATAEIAPALAEAGMVTDALWSDANGDGAPDLFVTTEYGPVRYFQNTGGRLIDQTEAAGLAGRLGWWNAVAAADVDSDGDLDVAVGNFGWNTKYHPTPHHPQLLYYGDFEGHGVAQIVEAHREDSGLLPVRGRSCSSQAMPFIKQKFDTFHDYALADLTEIYTEPLLRSALRLEANELGSGILLNSGNGDDGQPRFDFKPLPVLAQVAPCFGLAFLDWNGDGTPDLYVSQNFGSPQRETGRMAGGVGALLAGQGDGTFREVWPERSGIVVPDDARGAATIDLNNDGRPDIAVATNNGPLRVFLNGRR